MSEFEKRISSEELCSLFLRNCDFVKIPIRNRALSNSNLIDLRDDELPGDNSKISPKKRFRSMDDIFEASFSRRQREIMSDCVPSPESDSSYASSSRSGSSGSSAPICEISLLERLVRTHPVWFIPSLQRSGSVHLLQGRCVGNFIIRNCSTRDNAMCLSVKLTTHVEHYLLLAIANKISLEQSNNTFPNVHQLIAHYIETRDEIPVCLRMPSAIAEATTRQQLTSLALLGQEFWSIPPGSVTTSPSEGDAANSKNFAHSGIASQSSSSHSLSDLLTTKPSRPTTLELGTWKSGGTVSSATSNPPPPVPLRWSRSALLSPVSQPSSMQSTPSEVQSTFSEKSGRPGRKKKRSGGNKATPESIHYKDTEILDLFKGTKTYECDKASDYEDIWSPQYHERSHTPKLSTFKPDLIPATSEIVDNIHHLQNNKRASANHNDSISHIEEKIFSCQNYSVNALNIHQINNHRSSFNKTGVSKSNCNVNATSQNEINRKSSGLYSEPVDSITFRKREGGNREPNVRWSQPTLSLLKTDFDIYSMSEFPATLTGSGLGKPNITHLNSQKEETKNFNVEQQHANNITRSCADASSANKSVSAKQVCNSSKSSSNKTIRAAQSVTCASIDSLCHLSSICRRPSSQTKDCEDDEMEQVVNNNNNQDANIPAIVPNIDTFQGNDASSLTPEAPNSKSWALDNSWELVMWQKEQEKREKQKENVAKFPVALSPPNTPQASRRLMPNPSESSSSQTESALCSSNNNNDAYNSLRRFSCYDNLERSKAEINAEEELTDSDEDKISPPWDSSKWEHLMRIISESTQQLDLLSLVGNNNNTGSNNNASLHKNDTSLRPSGGGIALAPDPALKVTRMLDVGGNERTQKAEKSVAEVVKNLANKGDGVFGPTLKSFISCTIAAKVQDPFKVMRNIRQFISGMKNYLIGINLESEELRKEIKKQTENLSDNEFLNIDAILENVLVELVITPLNVHIRELIERYNAKNGEPIYLSKTKPGDIKQLQRSGNESILSKLKNVYSEFEKSVSPIYKIQKWNEFVCHVQDIDNYSSDSFLPLLAETLGSVCSEKLPSHVDYMIGLLPTSQAEQNNYSLSLLQSAVSALKVKADARKGSLSLTCVRVLIPDERNGTLVKKMVPVRSSTTSKDVQKIVASKLSITNPNDYVLVSVKNGEETLCPESELVYNCVEEDGTSVFAYKRIDAKIGWPRKIS